MKKIIPFNNVVSFNTDVHEITAISLEHEIQKQQDMISGTFYITGEYKITEGLLEKEKFDFELPFDIALTTNYNLDTLVVDIDDFRYELISDKQLKVNIDLYIDGEELELSLNTDDRTDDIPIDYSEYFNDNFTEAINIEKSTFEEEEKQDHRINTENFPNKNTILNEEEKNEEATTNKELNPPEESIIAKESAIEENRQEQFGDYKNDNLLKDMLTTDYKNPNNKENEMKDNINIHNDNININTNELVEEKETELKDINNMLFNNESIDETYVTYRVYKVTETDTLDSILTKYNVSKEMLADYNDIETIKAGDKLIIPTTINKD